MEIVISLIVFGVLVYELISGYVLTRSATQSQRISRKDQPKKFWLSVALQLIIATGLLLYGLGLFG